MQRRRGVGRPVTLSHWRWTHCVSSCRLLLMLLSYNSLFLVLSVAHWPKSCHYSPLTRAFGSTFAIASLQLCLSVQVCMCAYVCVSIRVCVLPSCSHSTSGSSCRALLHFCIIRSLPKVERGAGPSRRWTGTGEKKERREKWRKVKQGSILRSKGWKVEKEWHIWLTERKNERRDRGNGDRLTEGAYGGEKCKGHEETVSQGERGRETGWNMKSTWWERQTKRQSEGD